MQLYLELKEYNLSSTKKYILILSFWVAIGVLYGIQHYLFASLENEQCNLFNTLFDQIPNFVLWGLYTPFILFLRNKFPLHGENKLRNIFGIHLFALLLISTGHILLLGTIRWFVIAGSGSGSYVSYLMGYSAAWLYFQVVIYVMVILLGYAVEYYEKYQRKEETNIYLEKLLVDSELQRLKNQLQPHFLFNTLNTISMLIRQEESDKATKIVANLSTLLREILEKRYTQWTQLSNELLFVEKYLEIMSIRFKDKINYNINVEKGLETVLLPDLLLQPLVENSIKHGLNNKPGYGTINITIKSVNNKLEIKIIDDGIGCSEKELKEGVGLSNIKDRLKILYSDDFEFSIKSAKNKGTIVTITVPVILKIETVKNGED